MKVFRASMQRHKSLFLVLKRNDQTTNLELLVLISIMILSRGTLKTVNSH